MIYSESFVYKKFDKNVAEVILIYPFEVDYKSKKATPWNFQPVIFNCSRENSILISCRVFTEWI